MDLTHTLSSLPPADVLRVALWLVAGAIAFSFSVGSARIWTSISLGFFLVFVNEAYLLAPWVEHPRLVALHSVVGTLAVLVMTHGFQEYYVFSRTLEAPHAKWPVYGTTALVVLGSALFLAINPAPTPEVLERIRLVENACWTFLALINIDMVRKIHQQARDSELAPAFVAFAVTFVLVFLWRGSALYLQVYGWGADATVLDAYDTRIAISRTFHAVSGVLASLAVGGTFTYCYRLLR